MQKTATTIIPSTTIAAGETTALASCTAVDLSRTTQLILTVRGTFNAAATEGLVVYLYTSVDAVTYDDKYWDSWNEPNCRKVGYTSGTKEWMVGESITAQAGGTATVVNWTLTSGTWAANNAAGDIYLENITGTFTATQTLTGGTSGGTATQNGSIAAHAVIRTYFPTAVSPLYLKARIANQDTGQSITSASLIAVQQNI